MHTVAIVYDHTLPIVHAYAVVNAFTRAEVHASPMHSTCIFGYSTGIYFGHSTRMQDIRRIQILLDRAAQQKPW